MTVPGPWNGELSPAPTTDAGFVQPAWQPPSTDRGSGIATVLYVIVALDVIGALIGGIALMAHSVQAGCAEFGCDATRHPYIAAGLGVLVGGLVQAFVVYAVARLYRRS